MRIKTVGALGFVGAVLITLFNLAWIGALVCVAVHFLRKYW